MANQGLLIGIVAVVVVVIIAYVVLSSGRPGGYGTSTSSLYTTLYTNTTQATTAPVTTIKVESASNMTLNISQVVQALGTGWTAAGQNATYNSTTVKPANGTSATALSLAYSNFTNGGVELQSEWVKFGSQSTASSYASQSLNSIYPNANATTGTNGTAYYWYYAGDAINKGQAAAVIFAYDGDYAILINVKGSHVPLEQMQTLLTYQAQDLNSSS